MRVTLVHNPSAGEHAGHIDRPTTADLQRHLRDLGHDVRYASSKAEWQPLMEEPADSRAYAYAELDRSCCEWAPSDRPATSTTRL